MPWTDEAIACLVDQFGQPVVDMMRTLKLALDPRNSLNPGKIFPVAA